MTSIGSTSKRSGLRAALAIRYTRSVRPSRPATRPQHSFGASSRAWAIISSRCSGATSMAPSGYSRSALRFERVAILVALLAAERFLELAHAVADRAADLGELLRPEHDQRDGQDDDELEGSNGAGHCAAFVRTGNDVRRQYRRRSTPAQPVPRSNGCGTGCWPAICRRTTMCWASAPRIVVVVFMSCASRSLRAASS